MLVEVLMPKHGLNMSEGHITEIFKQVGDSVREGENLFAFETSKATVEVAAKASGLITKILTDVGEDVPVNDTVLIIDTEATAAAPATAPAAGETAAAPATAAEGGGYQPATPWVKKIARENNVALNTVTGTGNQGRITAEDVLAAAAAPAPAAAASKPAPAPAAPAFTFAPGSDLAEVPMNRIKRLTGEAMAASFRDVPHIYFSARANLEKLYAYRDQLLAETGVKYTFSDFFLVACARALERFPLANATFREGKIYAQQNVNIGVATATVNGLTVPVVHEAQRYTLAELARRRQEVVKKALEGKSAVEELEGGTFTITNLGMFGIDSFDPIINPPQAAILALGSIEDTAVVVDKAIKICPLLHLRLAGDHRVLDGADCAQFLAYIKTLLECGQPLV